jgi:hypothetical protein
MDGKSKLRWRLIALSIVVPVALVVLWIFWPDPRMAEAKRDIRKIEAFQKAHGRLPNSFAEICVIEDESGPIYYKKQDDDRYIVWYGLSVGESETYDSRTRGWSDI